MGVDRFLCLGSGAVGAGLWRSGPALPRGDPEVPSTGDLYRTGEGLGVEDAGSHAICPKVPIGGTGWSEKGFLGSAD